MGSRHDSAAGWNSAVIGEELQGGGAIRTAGASRAAISFTNGVLLRLNELSLVQLPQADASSPTPLQIESGKAYFFSRDVREFPTVETSIVSASIRGTEFAVSVEANAVTISVLNGAVDVHNNFGSVLLGDGEQAVTIRGQAPVKQIMLRPLDAVQWALYYPAVLSVSDYPDFLAGASVSQTEGFRAIERGDLALLPSYFRGKDWRDTVGRSLVAYRSGDLEAALRELEQVRGQPRESSTSLLLYRAALFLASGAPDRSEAALIEAEKSLVSRPESETKNRAFASLRSLQAIIALVRNDTAASARRAEEAFLLTPESASVLLTRSYIQQAQFNLTGALDSIQKASVVAPENPNIQARKAELLLSFGRLNQAEAGLEEAGDSEDPRLLTVRGFTALTQNEIDRARDLFARALRKEADSGLPLLGLGLVTIRRGDVSGGRRYLEEAVLREPSNSLFRSYLGKAFFEEERNDSADKELTIAKGLDPLDPTPYLYDAYNKLSQFRPVAALSDLEESIARNNNRAVYRSRLLLDQDLAVRSIGLSQIYSELGFEQAAREEAIKSIQQDYTNYSAHLLLAGSYIDSGDQYGQAVLSEFFLSQLLAPRDFAYPGGNSGAQASFNEYASLFDRNRHRTNLFGGFETALHLSNGGVTQTGTFDRWSYLLSYDSSFERGFRANGWERNNTAFGRVQYQPSYQTSLSSSTLFTQPQAGDNTIRFDENVFDRDRTQDLNTFIQQFGLRHQIDPGLLVIAQGLFSHTRDLIQDRAEDKEFFLLGFQNGEQVLLEPASVLTDRRDRKTFDNFRVDSQIIKQGESYSLVSGVGATTSHVRFSDDGQILPEEPIFQNAAFEFDSALSESEYFARAYSYATLRAAPWLDLNGGLSYVHLQYNNVFTPPYNGNIQEIDRANPKIGFSAYPAGDTILRAAYFQNLGTISLSEAGDIEPTLVGGFNQNILDFPGVRSKNFGAGVSHKIAKSTYFGSEYIHRDLDRELNLGLAGVAVNFDTGMILNNDMTEFLNFGAKDESIRSYLSQVLSDTVAATLKHTWSLHTENGLQTEGFDFGRETDSNEFAFNLNYFNRNGITLRAETAWRLQTISGLAPSMPDGTNGTRDFWLLNAGARYQFPRRYGTISLTFRNILDQKFRYQPTYLSADVRPQRSVELAFSVTF